MSKYNFDFKVKVVTEYLSGQAAYSLARKYEIGSCTTISIWIQRFERFGIKGLQPKAMDLEYTSQFKVDV
ncbi:helix-turn-helix domain-containing protein [Pediococcus siamensis]|uniref:helix-turn-helix domain-containing protein n=1 Tax=Pediococcus siamensis TaxID=381829 RepID=UPI0039A0A9F7